MDTTHVATDLTPRLEAAARRVADCRDALEAAHELRNALIVQAVDEGMSVRAVGRAASVAPGRVSAILGHGVA